jgi:hypothetical protein
VRRADPHRALIRALLARHPGLIVLASRTEPWASATFTGTRHELVCATGPNLAGIEEADFDLPGHIVADIGWSAEPGRLLIEALTLEDR